MKIIGQRNLDYAVIQIYTSRVECINSLFAVIPKISHILCKRVIPVFHTQLDDYQYIKVPFGIRSNHLRDVRNKYLHHYLYDIKDILSSLQLKHLLDFVSLYNTLICYHFDANSGIKSREQFLYIREKLTDKTRIYPSFAFSKPRVDLVKDLFTERQYVLIDGKVMSKYDIHFKLGKITQCNIYKELMYYDDNGFKYCPCFSKSMDSNNFIDAIGKNFILCREKCSPYLFEYGEKKTL